jgi:hypothetical protein
MRLLLTSDRSVTDVCFDVGYESLGSFITRFTQSFGLAPQRLRSLFEQFNQPWANWLNESSLSDLFDVPDQPPFVHGNVDSPTPFSGLIFVGLFPSPIPLGPPFACAVMREAGPFRIGGAPGTPTYLLAVGIPWSERPLDFLLNEQTMRGAWHKPIDPLTTHEWPIALRAPSSLDPPINLALPFLIVLRLLKINDSLSIANLHKKIRRIDVGLAVQSR